MSDQSKKEEDRLERSINKSGVKIFGNRSSGNFSDWRKKEEEAKQRKNELRTKEEEAILPTIENIIQRKYKLSRALKIFYKTDRAGTKVDPFIKYILSESGQKGVLHSGYLRSTLPEVEVNAIK